MARSEPVCVYCRRRPVDPAWRPFCSERCKLADLGRWLSESYRVPGERPPGGAPETEVDDGDGVDNDE